VSAQLHGGSFLARDDDGVDVSPVFSAREIWPADKKLVATKPVIFGPMHSAPLISSGVKPRRTPAGPCRGSWARRFSRIPFIFHGRPACGPAQKAAPGPSSRGNRIFLFFRTRITAKANRPFGTIPDLHRPESPLKKAPQQQGLTFKLGFEGVGGGRRLIRHRRKFQVEIHDIATPPYQLFAPLTAGRTGRSFLKTVIDGKKAAMEEKHGGY